MWQAYACSQDSGQVLLLEQSVAHIVLPWEDWPLGACLPWLSKAVQDLHATGLVTSKKPT